MFIPIFVVAFLIFGLVSLAVIIDNMDKATAQITAFISSYSLFVWTFYTFITALGK